MTAASFWKQARANYMTGRQQNAYNIYDTATNMGTPRSSYNRALTVVGPQRQQLEAGLAANYRTYRRGLASEAAAARAARQRQAIADLENTPYPVTPSGGIPINEGIQYTGGSAKVNQINTQLGQNAYIAATETPEMRVYRNQMKDYIGKFKAVYGFAPPGYENFK